MFLRKLIFLFMVLAGLRAPEIQAQDIYPVNWFAGMKWNKVQLLVKGTENGFNQSSVSLSYPGVTVLKTTPMQHGKYLAVDLSISPAAKPGDVKIRFSNKGNNTLVTWPLKAMRKGKGTSYAQGLSQADFIYLLMPDRFSNGDPSNDRIAGLRDQTLDRDSIFHRHGGDLQGVINQVDYLKNLGVTALWMTPVIQNDMPARTEHGYAFTNHYKIEPRFGGEEAYLSLSDKLHQQGMKLVQDAVYNHVGIRHFFAVEKPSADWFHEWPVYTNTTYKDQPLYDPYGAASDRRVMEDGWFTREMPDLNQRNPYVANFLIQHALWSTETFGVDAWRIDTYIYNDLAFMNRCNAALLAEYPRLSLFGETWVHGTVSQAYFAENTMQVPFKSNLPAVTDFQTLLYGIQPALNENFGWTEGVQKLYNVLSNDFLYTDPARNVIFLDNHDLSRFYSVVNKDINKLKMGILWLLTSRGIPQLYYGTEVLMSGYTNPDGNVRLDFPGGWSGDRMNGFTGAGLPDSVTSMQNFVRTVAQYRKGSKAITQGKLLQYLPKDGLYVYFRYAGNEKVMCVMNTDKKPRNISWASYPEMNLENADGTDIVTGMNIKNGFQIGPMDMKVIKF